jgi:hypothetical protein
MEPLTIRAHTLLCLQGFRGEGYSPDFIANMAEIHGRLGRHPEISVRVVAEPDALCAACPNLARSGCLLNGEGSEAEMQAQDREVMGRLSVSEGEVLPWGEILRRIAGRVDPEALSDICGSCRWLPLGYCREGIDRLKFET